MVVREVLHNALNQLRENNIDNAMFEAHLIIRTILNYEPLDLVIHKDKEIDESLITQISDIIKRRVNNEPLQYILGTQEFMSLPFKVTPDVLIPRSDTECLVEHILGKYKNMGISVLDIGSGSGCVGISIAVYNKRAYVREIDISERAIAIGVENAKLNGVDDRVSFTKCNILTDTIYGQYDVIVSNPPYIETEVIGTLDDNVKNFEPVLALDGGGDGLMFYRRIAKIAPTLLKKNGLLAFEVGHTQAKAVSDLMGANFENIEIIKDLCGIDRVVSGIIKK